MTRRYHQHRNGNRYYRIGKNVYTPDGVQIFDMAIVNLVLDALGDDSSNLYSNSAPIPTSSYDSSPSYSYSDSSGSSSDSGGGGSSGE